MRQSLLEAIKERVLLADGAMGTQLQQAGLEPGGCGEIWNVDNPEPVKAIRRPVRYDGERAPDATPAPRLGQHNQRVLAEAGFGAAEIAELAGGIRKPSGAA